MRMLTRELPARASRMLVQFVGWTLITGLHVVPFHLSYTGSSSSTLEPPRPLSVSVFGHSCAGS